MPNLSNLSVAEIHRQYSRLEQPISKGWVAALQADERLGVQRIYQRARQQLEKQAQERTRIESMLEIEQLLWQSGCRQVAGVDEVGMGPLAGPVVAAAVTFPPRIFIPGIDDSKRLPSVKREALARIVQKQALGIGLGVAEVSEIDQINVYYAGLLAMRRAVENLPFRPDHILLDAKSLPQLSIPQQSITKGDQRSFSIAAASIVAKTWRDQLMAKLHARFPHYGFNRHKGYCTREHQKALRKHGPCVVHRKSFSVIRELCGEYSTIFYQLRGEVCALSNAADLHALEEQLESLHVQLPQAEKRKIRLLLARRRHQLQLLSD